LLTGRGGRWGRGGAGDEHNGGERERPRSDNVWMMQSATHDAARRTLRASRLQTDTDLACRAGDQGFF